jgi:long-chain fatty acid transport protein
MKVTPSKLLPALMSAAALSVGTVQTIATGIRLPDQDAFATARGEAFVATADNPSAIYYNPAGLTQLQGHNLRGGVYGLDVGWSYESNSGKSSDSQKNLHAVPQFFYAYGCETLPLSFGLGLYAPYGLSSEWPQDSGFRTIATKGSLTYYTFNPVVAWRVVPSLSIAAGLTVNYSETDLERGLFWPAQSFDNFRFKGDAWDVGYNLGLLYKPIEQLSFGFSFRSPTTFDLEGSTRFKNDVPLPIPGGPTIPAFPEQRVDAKATFPFPLNAVFGVSYRPTPAWNFEFNADYTDWSRLGTITVHQATPFPPLLPQDLPLVLNWQPSWYYEFGATRYLRNGWSISAGYIYNENSVPDANYLPLVGDLDRHFFSVGTGFKGKHFGFDAAYQFGYGPARTVTGSAPSPTGQTADGKYDFTSHAIFLTAGWHF